MAEPTRIPDPRTSVVDIPRKKPPTRGRNIAIAVGGLAAVAAITFMLSRLRSAAPVVDRSSLWTDTVKRGPMLREVKGPGTLVPEQIRLITADTAGRVERIPLRPGARVDPGTILMELSNPDVMLQALDAERQLAQAKAHGVRMWSGYLQTRPNVNIAAPWTQQDFARVKAAGLLVYLVSRP